MGRGKVTDEADEDAECEPCSQNLNTLGHIFRQNLKFIKLF